MLGMAAVSASAVATKVAVALAGTLVMAALVQATITRRANLEPVAAEVALVVMGQILVELVVESEYWGKDQMALAARLVVALGLLVLEVQVKFMAVAEECQAALVTQEQSESSGPATYANSHQPGQQMNKDHHEICTLKHIQRRYPHSGLYRHAADAARSQGSALA